MNVVQSDHSCYVVPRWTTFKLATEEADFTSFAGHGSGYRVISRTASFEEDLRSFRACPDALMASDLMGVALALGELDLAAEMARFVRKNPIVGPLALNMAGRVLGDLELVMEPTILTHRTQIAEQKGFLSRFPRDAVTWTDRALNYVLLGSNEKAKKSILIALNLAPTDRFVVRAALRFFIHIGDWETAYNYGLRALKEGSDPWIAAPLTSVATHLKRVPNSLRSLFTRSFESPLDFHYSELREATATLELFNGSENRARKTFRKAWIKPARSVVAHSQWILRERLPGLVGEVEIDFNQSNQAMSEILAARFDFESAKVYLRKWIMEEPYSVAPYMQLSWIECVEERFDSAAQTVRQGLVANPKSYQLLNNLTFALLKLGRLDEAKICFSEMRCANEAMRDPACIATQGLMLMISGHASEGRAKYGESIEVALKQKDRRLAVRAVINYLVSEFDVYRAVNTELLDAVANALSGERNVTVLAASQALRRRMTTVESSNSQPKVAESAAKFVQRQIAEERAFFLEIGDIGNFEEPYSLATGHEGFTSNEIQSLPGLLQNGNPSKVSPVGL